MCKNLVKCKKMHILGGKMKKVTTSPRTIAHKYGHYFLLPSSGRAHCHLAPHLGSHLSKERRSPASSEMLSAELTIKHNATAK